MSVRIDLSLQLSLTGRIAILLGLLTNAIDRPVLKNFNGMGKKYQTLIKHQNRKDCHTHLIIISNVDDIIHRQDRNIWDGAGNTEKGY